MATTDVGRVALSHWNLNDGTLEGMRCLDVPALAVQYHPEAAPGPHDARSPVRGVPRADGGRLMPRRDDLAKIMVIGSGPIVIGQACEFDYSGTQACKVLRAEGFEVSLVNSNPATIMTDPAFADRTYIEPLTPGVGPADRGAREARRDPAHARRADRAQRERRPGGVRATSTGSASG